MKKLFEPDVYHAMRSRAAKEIAAACVPDAVTQTIARDFLRGRGLPPEALIETARVDAEILRGETQVRYVNREISTEEAAAGVRLCRALTEITDGLVRRWLI